MGDEAVRIATRAAELAGHEREAFLESACSGDSDLRGTVERLIGLQESVTVAGGDGAQSRPAGSCGASSGFRVPGSGECPTRIGSYRILDELGSGAMGVVYLAEQRRPKRRVALKVIRPEVLTPDRERRFDLEAESLARLRHPGIATIYEAGRGESEGQSGSAGRRAFFAMELVQGESLDRHARAIPIREQVALMADICDSVEHAHRRGILHRDLKPANIVVDEDGRAKVLDFGVARSLDSEHAGVAGELVGTLPYMSPEQLRADTDVDARSDVYALGVMLCEVLTGSRPNALDGMTIAEALVVVRKIPTVEVTRIGGELASVIKRALAPDRDSRYASAGDLAADLRRWIRNEPVDAFGGGRGYRAKKFAQRHRGAVVLGVLAAGAIVAGVGGVSWQAARATRGWAEAQRETVRAEEATEQASLERDRAKDALELAEADRRRLRAVNLFMVNMLTSADPEVARGEELTVRELLDASAMTVNAELGEEPEIHALVLMALSNTYLALGEVASAHRYATVMVRVCEESLGPESPTTGDAWLTLANVCAVTGELEEANRLIALAEPVIDEYADPVESARLLSQKARLFHQMGRFEESLALWMESEDRLGALLGMDSKDALIVKHNRALALKDIGRLDEAERVAREVVDLRRARFGTDHPQTLAGLDMLAGVILKQGREGDAVPIMREAVRGRRRVLGEGHISTLLSMGNLGAILIRLGDLDEAEGLTTTALSGHRAVFGDEHAKTLILMANMAFILEERGRLDEAAALYQEAIDIRRRSTGGRDPETWVPMNNLAMLYQRIGKPGDARPLYEDLLGMCTEMLPVGHYYTAIFRDNYAECLTELDEYDAAEAELDKSLPVLRATFGDGHERVLKSEARREAVRSARASQGSG